ncbi:MAG: ComF family protein [Candidatus Omnitrophica bacterium]|nr:ComF family protein [Candidatus Omnitrophota bacterium]
MHKRRLKEREYNQSILIANSISKEFALPIKNTLEKIRLTKNQNELLKKERHINLKGAFKILNGADITGRGLLLIDDVMTTGATLDECAKTFLAAGVNRVTCFTLARGI